MHTWGKFLLSVIWNSAAPPLLCSVFLHPDLSCAGSMTTCELRCDEILLPGYLNIHFPRLHSVICSPVGLLSAAQPALIKLSALIPSPGQSSTKSAAAFSLPLAYKLYISVMMHFFALWLLQLASISEKSLYFFWKSLLVFYLPYIK